LDCDDFSPLLHSFFMFLTDIRLFDLESGSSVEYTETRLSRVSGSEACALLFATQFWLTFVRDGGSGGIWNDGFRRNGSGERGKEESENDPFSPMSTTRPGKYSSSSCFLRRFVSDDTSILDDLAEGMKDMGDAVVMPLTASCGGKSGPSA